MIDNNIMKWNSIDVKPKKEYGWFAVAVLPRNHSGVVDEKSDFLGLCDLKGDNDWRKSFGFEKAWLHNGEWYVADHVGPRCKNITKLVTHWGEHLREMSKEELIQMILKLTSK